MENLKVLVTGAGGSIGSALCKALKVRELVLYEHSEYALYKINEELTCNRLAVLGDIKDTERLSKFMDGVDVVFHCAAYKHVPILEGINSEEAIKNNVAGTRSVMKAAIKVPTVVLLSTDKAINPLSVMGKSKYQAEQIAKDYKRTIARLVNIYASSGSVVPKFMEQIEKNQPLTVTDMETTRYFIPMFRAVEFLIDCSKKPAGTYQIKDVQPTRIVDLAQDLIRQSGKDLPIVITGLRPGEKLHEELE